MHGDVCRISNIRQFDRNELFFHGKFANVSSLNPHVILSC